MSQGSERQVTAAADAAEDSAPQEAHPAKALPDVTMEALRQALSDAQLAGEPVDALFEAVASDEEIKAEIINNESEGRLVVITVEPEEPQRCQRPRRRPRRRPRNTNRPESPREWQGEEGFGSRGGRGKVRAKRKIRRWPDFRVLEVGAIITRRANIHIFAI
jgi:hypothetical protein